MTRDFDLQWKYDQPAETEATFRSMLADTESEAYRLELLTQIARAQGLQREFDAANKTLDEVEPQVAHRKDRVRVRYFLERGRVLNSSGEKARARPFFEEAYELAKQLHEDFLTVDAAHMIAIVDPPESAMEWNIKALEIAQDSKDERARNWAGSLYNNIGWTLHDQGKCDEALKMFQRALEFRVGQGKRDPILVARWCIARCLRSLGRVQEALEIQLQLQETRELHAEPDGYVQEEIGECLLALGRPEDAKPAFASAYEQLSQDPWLRANEPDRLERLQKLAG